MFYAHYWSPYVVTSDILHKYRVYPGRKGSQPRPTPVAVVSGSRGIPIRIGHDRNAAVISSTARRVRLRAGLQLRLADFAGARLQCHWMQQGTPCRTRESQSALG